MNIKHLELLANYLDGFDMKFGWSDWFDGVPHIEGFRQELPKERDHNYLCDHLGINTEQYRWCFDATWCLYDNTHQGAAKRIRCLVDNNGLCDWDGIIKPEHVDMYQHY